MSSNPLVQHVYTADCCVLRLQQKRSNATGCDGRHGRSIENVRNCDIFIEDYHFLIYWDVQLYKFRSLRRFDLKDLKNVIFQYNSNEKELKVSLPCLEAGESEQPEKSAQENKKSAEERGLDLWKLKKITDQCLLRIDDKEELLRPEGCFAYGFASKFQGHIRNFECNLEAVTRMPEPCDTSPLQRTIDREIDEMKNFSRDQYKLNFVELQVPEGLENPLHYIVNLKDCSLDRDEECLLHNLTANAEANGLPDQCDLNEIDCGLINICLAICYDVRFTANEPNCESAWTRSILSATLTYFEPFNSLKEVVISFIRRSLIYPLYRNYELGRQCILDCVAVLQKKPWILKQLLVTHDLFEANERAVFNHYYIADYIRYVANEERCSREHLQTLARNLKNVLLDVSKKHLGLGLHEIETELLKELITDMHGASAQSDEEDCDDNGSTTDSDDSSSSEDSSSDSDKDSVIEQRISSLQL